MQIHKISILIIVLLSFFTQDITAGGKYQSLTIRTTIHCDHCQQCPDCRANITKHVKKNKGVKKVTVNPAENTITVMYDAARTNPEAIRNSINTAGFDADDRKAPAEAVAKLDGCCKAK
jgi:periplasmic mercuric ion binding protein